MQVNWKRIALGVTPALIGGWYLFRPELLFVDQKVSEKAPAITAGAGMSLGKGSFASYAHETTGDAELIQSMGKSFVRLSQFKTSNGPDVHIYLVKGEDPTSMGVKQNGFLDLGTLKGNIGDQNYEVPANTDVKAYRSVTIWCKRFGVGFGGATFQTAKPKVSARPLQLQTASFGEEILVTGGSFRSVNHSVSGIAQIVERDGKRFLSLSQLRSTAKGQPHFALVKLETISSYAEFVKAPKVDLGTISTQTKAKAFPISKDLDAWLYRTVAVWDPQSKKLIATVELRSDQERHPSALSI